LKENSLLVVITAGNYNKWDIENISNAILKKYILPLISPNKNKNAYK
jgi:hypothetical protein